MAGRSNVGYPSSYEDGDQHHYSTADVSRAGHTHGINTAGYMNKDKIVNQLHEDDIQEQIKDRVKHDPGFAATMHGNKPSRGAMVDASIAKEEADLLAKKKSKTDGMTGKRGSSGSVSE
ncbi:hypothetical protein NM208_g10361 [Fusarium decemcellulare]|uniref:Uncharacterized protein n=1 Tax=Fusarium decemcellulare TaxID=57161 RepID=A0ACC1RY49_9HYPO|nr:hypothetical protein NM208_g10361 [Fusarium decemcellulare]